LTPELETCRWPCKGCTVSATSSRVKLWFIDLSIETMQAYKPFGNTTNRAEV